MVPGISLIVFVLALKNDITNPYENYPQWALWTFGWGICIVLTAICLFFSFKKSKTPELNN